MRACPAPTPTFLLCPLGIMASLGVGFAQGRCTEVIGLGAHGM